MKITLPPPFPPSQRPVTVSVERLSVISSGSTVSVTSLAEGSKDKKDQYDSFNPFDDEELVSDTDHHAAEPSLPQSAPVIRPRMNSHERTISEGRESVSEQTVTVPLPSTESMECIESIPSIEAMESTESNNHR